MVAPTSKFVAFFFNFLLHQNIHGSPLVLLLLESFLYLRGYLSSHLYVQIFFLGGGPMKISFQMLAFLTF
jgi:hypothetical protein